MNGFPGRIVSFSWKKAAGGLSIPTTLCHISQSFRGLVHAAAAVWDCDLSNFGVATQSLMMFPTWGKGSSAVAQFFNGFLSPWVSSLFGLLPEGAVGYLLAAAIHVALLINVVAVGALVFIWLERKVAGRIQDRLGPTRVGGKFGWLQTLADGIKLIAKEDITPKDADGMLFRIAPYISFAASFTAYFALPFADGWAAQEVNVAVFFIIAVLGLEVFGVILAGYASGSKWSLFGGMREAAQVVSYEVPIGMCVVIPVLICGTMNLVTIGNMQAGWFTNWLVFHDPFTFLVFWVYFTCAIASVNRAPFDLAEAESELVAGFHTEYSGLRWSFFFMAEYGSMFLVSALAAILFFGGWHGPIPLFGPEMLGWSEYVPVSIKDSGSWAWYVSQIAGTTNLILKAVFGVTVMMWVRWTLPRLRIDQVMTTCLKYCVPLAAFCFLGATWWQLMGFKFINDLAPSDNLPRAAIRENWVYAAAAEAKAAEPASESEPPKEMQEPAPEVSDPQDRVTQSPPQRDVVSSDRKELQ